MDAYTPIEQAMGWYYYLEEALKFPFTLIWWERHAFAVPLSQLEGLHMGRQTRQAIEDWQYWVKRGYEL